MYIYEHSEWPIFIWSDKLIINQLAQVKYLQGRLLGRMESFGFNLQEQANHEILTQDVLKTSEIEGEVLNDWQVRSSIARKLGLDISGMVTSDRHVDGVVEMMLDATGNYNEALTKEILFDWHSALFPTGRSGIRKIIAGGWRKDTKGPMQVVSGTPGKENIHFEAPPAAVLEKQMAEFLCWFNQKSKVDLVLKAAIAHLWFITLHPFEDGNGRIARAIADKILAQSDAQNKRFYSMSSQIRKERNDYYAILEKTQKGSLDITEWMVWFLSCLKSSIESSDLILEQVLKKHNFWMKNNSKVSNDRQRKMLNRLLEGFEGKLTSSKWAKMNKCSQDTALRDINELIKKDVLMKMPAGGRSSAYALKD